MKVSSAMFFAAVLASSAAWADDAGSTGYVSVTADEVVALLTGPVPPHVFDVRTESEYSRAHLPGSALLPWEKDAARFVAGLPSDKGLTLVFYCNGPT